MILVKCPRCEKDFPVEDIYMFSFDRLFTYLDPYCCKDCLDNYICDIVSSIQWIRRFESCGGIYPRIEAWNGESLIGQLCNCEIWYSSFKIWSAHIEPEDVCPKCGFILNNCLDEEDDDHFICRNCGYSITSEEWGERLNNASC